MKYNITEIKNDLLSTNLSPVEVVNLIGSLNANDKKAIGKFAAQHINEKYLAIKNSLSLSMFDELNIYYNSIKCANLITCVLICYDTIEPSPSLVSQNDLTKVNSVSPSLDIDGIHNCIKNFLYTTITYQIKETMFSEDGDYVYDYYVKDTKNALRDPNTIKAITNVLPNEKIAQLMSAILQVQYDKADKAKYLPKQILNPEQFKSYIVGNSPLSLRLKACFVANDINEIMQDILCVYEAETAKDNFINALIDIQPNYLDNNLVLAAIENFILRNPANIFSQSSQNAFISHLLQNKQTSREFFLTKTEIVNYFTTDADLIYKIRACFFAQTLEIADETFIQLYNSTLDQPQLFENNLYPEYKDACQNNNDKNYNAKCEQITNKYLQENLLTCSGHLLSSLPIYFFELNNQNLNHSNKLDIIKKSLLALTSEPNTNKDYLTNYVKNIYELIYHGFLDRTESHDNLNLKYLLSICPQELINDFWIILKKIDSSKNPDHSFFIHKLIKVIAILNSINFKFVDGCAEFLIEFIKQEPKFVDKDSSKYITRLVNAIFSYLSNNNKQKLLNIIHQIDSNSKNIITSAKIIDSVNKNIINTNKNGFYENPIIISPSKNQVLFLLNRDRHFSLDLGDNKKLIIDSLAQPIENWEFKKQKILFEAIKKVDLHYLQSIYPSLKQFSDYILNDAIANSVNNTFLLNLIVKDPAQRKKIADSLKQLINPEAVSTHYQQMAKSDLAQIWLPYSLINVPKNAKPTPQYILDFVELLDNDGQNWQTPPNYPKIAKILLDITLANTQESPLTKNIFSKMLADPNFKLALYAMLNGCTSSNELDNRPSDALESTAILENASQEYKTSGNDEYANQYNTLDYINFLVDTFGTNFLIDYLNGSSTEEAKMQLAATQNYQSARITVDNSIKNIIAYLSQNNDYIADFLPMAQEISSAATRHELFAELWLIISANNQQDLMGLFMLTMLANRRKHQDPVLEQGLYEKYFNSDSDFKANFIKYCHTIEYTSGWIENEWLKNFASLNPIKHETTLNIYFDAAINYLISSDANTEEFARNAMATITNIIQNNLFLNQLFAAIQRQKDSSEFSFRIMMQKIIAKAKDCKEYHTIENLFLKILDKTYKNECSDYEPNKMSISESLQNNILVSNKELIVELMPLVIAENLPTLLNEFFYENIEQHLINFLEALDPYLLDKQMRLEIIENIENFIKTNSGGQLWIGAANLMPTLNDALLSFNLNTNQFQITYWNNNQELSQQVIMYNFAENILQDIKSIFTEIGRGIKHFDDLDKKQQELIKGFMPFILSNCDTNLKLSVLVSQDMLEQINNSRSLTWILAWYTYQLPKSINSKLLEDLYESSKRYPTRDTSYCKDLKYIKNQKEFEANLNMSLISTNKFSESETSRFNLANNKAKEIAINFYSSSARKNTNDVWQQSLPVLPLPPENYQSYLITSIQQLTSRVGFFTPSAPIANKEGEAYRVELKEPSAPEEIPIAEVIEDTQNKTKGLK